MLSQKIKSLYPELTDADFHPNGGTIALQNDGDGDYIAKWEHPTLVKPTVNELAD